MKGHAIAAQLIGLGSLHGVWKAISAAYYI